jgi:hypothetical protein
MPIPWPTRTTATDRPLAGADLSGFRLVRADLTGADLTGAALDGADVRGADLREARGVDDRMLEAMRVDTETRLPPPLLPPKAASEA